MLQREDEDGDANDEEEVDGLPGVNSYCFVSGGLVVLWYGCSILQLGSCSCPCGFIIEQHKLVPAKVAS